MEDAIYKRQINKLSMSKRVVDELQVDRHFERNDLDELYSIRNIEPPPISDASSKAVPNDRILSNLLIKFKNIIYQYQRHDSLLQNKEDEDLSLEERQLAWYEFENEDPEIMRSNNSIRFPSLQIGNIFYLIFFFS